MIAIKSISVDNKYGTDFLVVRWEVEAPTYENVVYNVYRSLVSPESEFELVGSNITNTEYKDTTINLLDNGLEIYYKVGVFNLDTGVEVISNIVGGTIIYSLDNIAQAILYSNKAVLDLITDYKPNAYILLRRHEGIPCPDCWDPIRRAPTKSVCLTCYNTGFDKGYSNPIEVQVALLPSASVVGVEPTSQIDLTPQTTSGWMLNYPVINPGDLLVLGEDRYEIRSVQTTVKNHKIMLRQMFEAQKLPPTNIVYKIPIY